MLINDSEYQKTFQEAVECIKAAQYSAVVSANLALLHRNLRLGQIIIQKSQWGNKEFFIDLLFYSYMLHCFFAIELKTGKFLPEYAGKMNFYLSVLDKQVKGEGDNPSIGLILCKDRNKLVVEYALKDVSKPIGVSEYRLLKDVPEELQDTVPSLEDIESRVMNKYKCE